MNSNYIIITLVGLAIFGFTVLLWQSQIWNEQTAKDNAQKILDFRNSDQTCVKLRTMYLQYYGHQYDTMQNHDWYWEVHDKFVNKCVDKTQLDNIEMLEICSDAHFTSCEISKLENPELYKDFNFKTSILNLKLKDGSEKESSDSKYD